MKKNITDKVREKARRIAEDDGQIGELINKVKEKIAEVAKSDSLKQLFTTVELLIRMMKSYLSGEYRNYPKRTLLLILFGLIYFLMPIDAIPDFIPITGFLDDLTILLWVL